MALELALAGLVESGELKALPFTGTVAALSVGVVDMRGGSPVRAGTFPYDGGDLVTDWHRHDLHQIEYAFQGVGVVDGQPLCDLDYAEDSRADVDANVVMTGNGGLVEVQATAEQTPLSRASLDELLALAEAGIADLRAFQLEATGA